MSPIATTHAHIVALTAASGLNANVMGVVDALTNQALRAVPESAADALLQIDLAVPLMDAARDDFEGVHREAADRVLLALAAASTALARHAGRPLQDEGTLSDLCTFTCLAGSRYLLEAA